MPAKTEQLSDDLNNPYGYGSDIHVMLALRRSSRQVVVANKQLDGTDMIGELLGKR
jgi:hypothetical protein